MRESQERLRWYASSGSLRRIGGTGTTTAVAYANLRSKERLVLGQIALEQDFLYGLIATETWRCLQGERSR